MGKIKAIAPSGKISKEKFFLGKANLENHFSYKIEYSDVVFEIKRTMAGSEEKRAEDILKALQDENLELLWAIRGGFGVNRLLPFLPKKLDLDLSKKLLVGYSDITALQFFCYKFYGMKSISGQMLQIDFNDMQSKLAEFQQLFELIQNDESHFAMPRLVKFENFVDIEGVILGGCLSVITKLLGSPYMPDLSGKILFLEDLNEEIYKLDGLFSQLKNAGVFKALRGVILGQFFAPKESDNEKFDEELKELFSEYFFELDIPVIWNFPIGHIEHITPLPIGYNAKITQNNMSFYK